MVRSQRAPTDSRTLHAMNAPHWDAWSVENLPGLSESLKVAEMVRWWQRDAAIKRAAEGTADITSPLRDVYLEFRTRGLLALQKQADQLA